MLLHVLVISLTALFFLVGVIGSVVPLLPGAPLILVGAFLYAWYTDFISITWTTLIWLAVLTTLSYSLEFLASVLGVKKYGGTSWGMAGAFLGAILGIFFGIPGLILGPFLGALFLEMIRTGDLKQSLRSGWGTFIGFLLGTLGKLVIALIMIGVFLLKMMP